MFTYALNHIIQPSLSIDAFFSLAKSTQCTAVEIRNDLPGTAILDGTTANTVKELSDRYQLSILSINALQKFNHWNPERAQLAIDLFEYAEACGAQAVVLVPDNEDNGEPVEQRRQKLREALTKLKPLLDKHHLLGLVEPLGFATSSLRTKREAVEAITEISGTDSFALVHDTFHHYLSDEKELFPELTGLIHASGVTHRSQPKQALRDEHRALIDNDDIMDNEGQISSLLKANSKLTISLEPFSPTIQNQSDPKNQIIDCFKHLENVVA